MPAPNHWNSDVTDLRKRAQYVTMTEVKSDPITARTAARCLSGVVNLIARGFSVDVMQRTCAELVRSDVAWATSFGTLPRENGSVSEPMQLVAIIARGILPLAGVENLRAALSFWATESDPMVWHSVAEG